MADPRGFLRIGRENPTRRPVAERVRDWRELYEPFPADKLAAQATRCMDCGIPFCHEGCPLGNLIPEWNDLVRRGQFAEASERLHATNNFPEFTGKLCPAPCEGSCVLGISSEPVTIKKIEEDIAEWQRRAGLVPRPPTRSTSRSVAIVGSGPAGLAAAQQLTRAGHRVVVFERAEHLGGLLRYGVPEFKIEKHVIDDRLAQMEAEGTRFSTKVSVGRLPSGKARLSAAKDASVVSLEELRGDFDAVVLAIGSTRPRDLLVPGRELSGIHFAMEYLKGANLVVEGLAEHPAIDAAGRDVVIIGGGDTGADCLGTVHRQGARSVTQLEILPEPPGQRREDNPWPTWPVILRLAAAHEEGGERLYSMATSEFVGDANNRVRALRATALVRDGEGAPTSSGAPVELSADLVLLALGFSGPEPDGLVRGGLELDGRGNLAVDWSFMTSIEGVFACGDAVRGQSLIVWAIAEGRSAASHVDRFLMGETDLPCPLSPGELALS